MTTPDTPPICAACRHERGEHHATGCSFPSMCPCFGFRAGRTPSSAGADPLAMAEYHAEALRDVLAREASAEGSPHAEPFRQAALRAEELDAPLDRDRLARLMAAHEFDPPMTTNCDLCYLLAELRAARLSRPSDDPEEDR